MTGESKQLSVLENEDEEGDGMCCICIVGKNPKWCSRCKSVRYCEGKCQKGHWSLHKPHCKLIAEVRQYDSKDVTSTTSLRKSYSEFIKQKLLTSEIWHTLHNKVKGGGKAFSQHIYLDMYKYAETRDVLKSYEVRVNGKGAMDWPSGNELVLTIEYEFMDINEQRDTAVAFCPIPKPS